MPTRNQLFYELIIAIIFPPLAVIIQLWSFKRREVWICLLLTILGYFPGLLYAIYTVIVDPDHEGEEEVIFRPIIIMPFATLT